MCHLREGGTRSWGRVRGSGYPVLAMSTRCMARMNSSARSCPSLSTSARYLDDKIRPHWEQILTSMSHSNGFCWPTAKSQKLLLSERHHGNLSWTASMLQRSNRTNHSASSELLHASSLIYEIKLVTLCSDTLSIIYYYISGIPSNNKKWKKCKVWI